MTHRYDKMIGEKSVKPTRNYHIADKGSRIYLCGCYRQIKLPNGYFLKMTTKFGMKRLYRSEFKIRY